MRGASDHTSVTPGSRGRPGRSRAIGAAGIATAVLGAVALVPSASGSDPATTRAGGQGATAQRTSCASLSRQVRRATGKKRTAAKRRLAACKAENRQNARVLAKVRGSRFVGTRGDGEVVDWVFCTDGRYTLRSTSGGSTGVSSGRSWRITDATGTSASRFTAYVGDPKEGLEVGIAYRGGAWQVGVARSFGEIDDLGPVTRTDAKDACAELPTTR